MAKKELAERIANPTFDYAGFDPELKGKLICLTGEINRSKGDHIRAALVMGEAISAANDLLSEHGKYGRFGQWIEQECGISRTTAHNYMWAWDKFGKCDSVSHFDDSAMYALAAPKAPTAAIEEAKKLAAKGVRITVRKAKQLLEAYVPKRSPRSDGDCSTIEQPTAQSSGKTTTAHPQPVSQDGQDGATEGPGADGDASTPVPADTSAGESAPPPKPDKGLEFDPAKLEKESRRRVGKPLIDRKVRTKAQKHLGDLIRVLSEIGIYEEHEPALSAVAKHLQEI